MRFYHDVVDITYTHRLVRKHSLTCINIVDKEVKSSFRQMELRNQQQQIAFNIVYRYSKSVHLRILGIFSIPDDSSVSCDDEI